MKFSFNNIYFSFPILQYKIGKGLHLDVEVIPIIAIVSYASSIYITQILIYPVPIVNVLHCLSSTTSRHPSYMRKRAVRVLGQEQNKLIMMNAVRSI